MVDYIPLKDEDGNWIGNPGLMFWCATRFSDVKLMRETHRELSRFETSSRDRPAKEFRRFVRKDRTNRMHAGVVILEIQRAIARGETECSLGDGLLRAAGLKYQVDLEIDPSDTQRNNSSKTRDSGFLNQSVDTIKEARRMYRRISHFLAVMALGDDRVYRATSDDLSGEWCLGLARGYQDFILEHCKDSDFDLIRVPDEIPRIDPASIPFNSEYFEGKIFKADLNHYK